MVHLENFLPFLFCDGFKKIKKRNFRKKLELSARPSKWLFGTWNWKPRVWVYVLHHTETANLNSGKPLWEAAGRNSAPSTHRVLVKFFWTSLSSRKPGCDWLFCSWDKVAIQDARSVFTSFFSGKNIFQWFSLFFSPLTRLKVYRR